MIASLSGTLTAIGKDYIILGVGGIGFRVFAPQTLLEGAGGPGQELTVFTHLHVRETEISLYGCATEEELVLFRMLLGVSGIGPKVALAALSFLSVDRLRVAIVSEDITTLARVPGIGPKTAKKLVLDLRDKLAAELPVGAPQPMLTPIDADLVAALTGLGYSVAEAQAAIRALPREPLSLEERVRLALAYFAS